MRRTVTIIVSATAAWLSLGIPPAHAHTSIHIAAFQYGTQQDFGVGGAGWIGLPSGPVRIGAGPAEAEGFETVSNRDSIPHTFTECTTSCDMVLPNGGNFAGASFDVRVEPLAVADLSALSVSGTIVFGCRIHPFMRGEVTVTG